MAHFKSTLPAEELAGRGVSYPHRNPDGTFTGAYVSWHGAVQRCTDPGSKAWPYYGGRGITMTPRWLGPGGFGNFLADMGERPKGRSLDRKNNDGPYSPENCRWATRSQQQQNKSSWRKDRCGKGHLLAEVGVYVNRSTGGHQCRRCNLDSAKARDAKKDRQRRYRLTAGDVAWIRADYETVKQKDMVLKFGVSKLTIRKAALGEGRFENV